MRLRLGSNRPPRRRLRQHFRRLGIFRAAEGTPLLYAGAYRNPARGRMKVRAFGVAAGLLLSEAKVERFILCCIRYIPANGRRYAPLGATRFRSRRTRAFLIFFVRGSLLTNLPARVASYSRTSVIVRLCGYGYRCLHRCRSLYVTAYIRICRQKYVNPQRRMNRRRYVNTQVRIRVSERVKY